MLGGNLTLMHLRELSSIDRWSTHNWSLRQPRSRGQAGTTCSLCRRLPILSRRVSSLLLVRKLRNRRSRSISTRCTYLSRITILWYLCLKACIWKRWLSLVCRRRECTRCRERGLLEGRLWWLNIRWLIRLWSLGIWWLLRRRTLDKSIGRHTIRRRWENHRCW